MYLLCHLLGKYLSLLSGGNQVNYGDLGQDIRSQGRQSIPGSAEYDLGVVRFFFLIFILTF
jgi:hypothetical protein